MGFVSYTEQQIFDYIKCPLRYDSQYNLKIVPENHPSFAQLLNVTTSAFLLSLMSDKVMSTGLLKRKWDVICEANQDIISPQKCLEGLTALLNMYRWAENEQLIVSDLKIPFTYSEVPHLLVKGEIGGAIVPLKRKKFEILYLDYGYKYPDQALIDTKMKYTMDWVAFHMLYPKQKLAGIHIHHVKSSKDWYTVRAKEDMLRLREAVRNIAISIKNRLFYPRENVMCSSCDMKMYCRAWRGREKEVK